jgi:Secretion system C-terminal sorting domain
MRKLLLLIITTSSAFFANAQYPTTVVPANNCVVVRTFTTSDEGFSSSSIYSDANDVSFNWNAILGAEIESSGLATRNASLISPVYLNSDLGQLTFGFRYAAPAGTEYRVRIISGVINPPLEVLATTANGPIYTPLPSTAGRLCLTLADLDLTAGKAIRIEVTFRVINRPGENILFDDLALTVQGGPLPVTFTGFVARKNIDESLQLLWNVGEEINVKGYYVEASSDGNNFTNAGYVTANGKNIYSLNYLDKLNQTTYFRVRNIDFDGRSKYTPIIKVYGKDKTVSQIEIYPTPAIDAVTIQHNKSAQRATITLYTTDGKVILQKLAQLNTFQTQVNVGTLPSGMYLVKYDDGTGNVQSKTLYKN